MMTLNYILHFYYSFPDLSFAQKIQSIVFQTNPHLYMVSLALIVDFYHQCIY